MVLVRRGQPWTDASAYRLLWLLRSQKPWIQPLGSYICLRWTIVRSIYTRYTVPYCALLLDRGRRPVTILTSAKLCVLPLIETGTLAER